MKQFRTGTLLSAGVLTILLLAVLISITNSLQERQKEITSGDFRTTDELIFRFGPPTEITESYVDGVRLENWQYSRKMPFFKYNVAYTIENDEVVAFIQPNE